MASRVHREEEDRTYVLSKPHVDAKAPHAARAAAAKALADWGFASLVDNVTLCVSELVTNTLDAEADEIAVLVEWHKDDHLIELAVWDNAPGEPEKREPSVHDLAGRGLMIVEALADEWGCRAGDDGKVTWVWFSTGGAPDAA
jgi:anti-sigma regulatory factor (Ser/Thr protein kinase)